MALWERILSALRGRGPRRVEPEDARGAWERVAASFGGKVTVWGRWPISLIAIVSDTLVAALISEEGDTRVGATVHGEGLTLALNRRPCDGEHPDGHIYGSPVEQIAVAGVDELFSAEAYDPSAAQAWIAAAAEALVRSRYCFAVKNSEAVGYIAHPEYSTESLETALRAVAALAGSGRALAAAWRQLAADLGGSLRADSEAWAPGSDFAIDTERFRVDVERERFGLSQRARSHLRVSIERMTPGAPFRQTGPDWEAFLDEAGTRRLRALPAVAVGGDARRLWILLTGVMAEAATVRDAAELLAQLAAAEGGPYR